MLETHTKRERREARGGASETKAAARLGCGSVLPPRGGGRDNPCKVLVSRQLRVTCAHVDSGIRHGGRAGAVVSSNMARYLPWEEGLGWVGLGAGVEGYVPTVKLVLCTHVVGWAFGGGGEKQIAQLPKQRRELEGRQTHTHSSLHTIYSLAQTYTQIHTRLTHTRSRR